ncbi:MAG TPA: hypothetical protein VF575_01905 [Candidatus Saccharimonadales bacterium]|jgi:(2Fe-2S) ferredoxin
MNVFDAAHNYLNAVERSRKAWEIDHNVASMTATLGAVVLAPVITAMAERVIYGTALDHFDTNQIVDSQLSGELVTRIEVAEAVLSRHKGYDLMTELD